MQSKDDKQALYLLLIKHVQPIVEHRMCDGPFFESELVAHVEPCGGR